MAELKPCPFCGGKVTRINAFGFGQYSVECCSCHVETARGFGMNAVEFNGEVIANGAKEAIEAAGGTVEVI